MNDDFFAPGAVSENVIYEDSIERLSETVLGAEDITIEEEKVVRDVLENLSSSSDIVVVGSDEASENVENEENAKTYIYIIKKTETSDNGSVSCDAVFRLDDSQYEFLIDTISNCVRQETREETPIIVNVSDNSAYYEEINNHLTGLTGLNIILIGLSFGYFVKETLFRGV